MNLESTKMMPSQTFFNPQKVPKVRSRSFYKHVKHSANEH